MRTEAELAEIIRRGERYDVELKGEEGGPLADADLVEAVVCQANGRGGLLLVGVEDDGRVTGAHPRHGSYTDVRRLEALIANGTVPSCPTECSIARVDGREIIVVEIPEGLPITSTATGVYRRRATDAHGRPRCLPFLHHEMQSREGDRGRLDQSALILPEATWEDLDPLELERLRQTVERNRGRADSSLLGLSDVEIVKALGLGEGGERIERVRAAGLLMLGREAALRRLLPTHEAAFQVLSGTRVAVNEFFRWPLIKLSEEMGRRFDARNEEEEIAVGMVRVGVPAYSPAGFREALHNAFIHRDYGRLGAVHVQWRGEEIEIANPGGFVEGVSIDTLLVATPRSRNPLLADAFKRIGLVERTGRGVDTIYEGQLRYGRPAPDYSRSGATEVKVVLPGGPANLALARLVIERDAPAHPVTLDELLILNALERDRRLDAGEAARLVQKSDRAAKALLQRLAEAGLLAERREGRDRFYALSDATERSLGAAASSGRAIGADPVRQEQMILDHVAANGRITRSQAADLCGLEGREARHLLQKLVNRGELVVRGERRGSYYERPEPVMSDGSKL